jgi:hypothetical protein
LNFWYAVRLFFSESGFLESLEESVAAPIPALVVGYDWAFCPDWVWRNTASFLALSLALNDDDDMDHYASTL